MQRNTTIIILAVITLLLMGATRDNRNVDYLGPRADAPEYAERGPHAVGTRDITTDEGAPLDVTLWYPLSADAGVSVDAGTPAPTAYPFQVKLFAPFGRVTVARSAGLASADAPLQPAADPLPAVILSAGFALGRTNYAWLAEHLASYGFVVIGVDHDERLSGDMDTFWRAGITRPQDVAHVMAYVEREAAPGGLLAGLVDSQRVAVVGHSYGGYTALAAAGARLDDAHLRAQCAAAADAAATGAAGETWLCDMLVPHLDAMAQLAGLQQAPGGLWPAPASTGDGPRVAAVVSLAGDAFQYGPDGLAPVTAPVLAIGGTADTGTPYRWGTQPTFEQVGSTTRVRVGLVDAEHMVFTGHCQRTRLILRPLAGEFCADPVWDRQRAHDVTNHFATVFLLAELAGDADAAAALAPAAVALPDVTYDAVGY